MSLVKFSRNYPSVFDRFFDNDLFDWTNRNFSTTNTTLPSVNVKESEKNFEVEVAAPGFNKSDFKIELNRDLLTVSSEKKVEKETSEGQRFTCREFSYQSFSRTFTLPNIADGERIEAKYDNGILTVTIPKKEEIINKQNRLIEIN
jgi:HSP20 family protein